MQVADITSCGWNVIDGILSIDWDSDVNQATVNESTFVDERMQVQDRLYNRQVWVSEERGKLF